MDWVGWVIIISFIVVIVIRLAIRILFGPVDKHETGYDDEK